MVQSKSIASLINGSFHSIDTLILFYLNENYKVKKLLAKVEKVLTFLSLPFFNLE